MKKLLLFCFCLNLFVIHAQYDSTTFFKDFNFIIHLSANKLFDEAEFESDRFFRNGQINQNYKDSVNFFLGQAYDSEKKFDQAYQKYLDVSDAPFFYYKARYRAQIIDLEREKIPEALKILSSIEESTSKDLNELKIFEFAGTHLLNKDYRVYDSLVKDLQFTNPLLQEELAHLNEYSARGKKIKRKSPFIAGTLSAIIPGLGKVYAGNNGQALASFLTVGLMGGIAFENYYKWGILHPQTLFFTGMFGLFYIGNIWGSAVSVQLVKTEKELENKHNILVGLKLPVSKFFN